jgi:hypothetical protein
MSEPAIMELGMHIMAPEPISMAYFINPFHQSVCLYLYLPIAASHQLGKNITVAINTHARIEELFVASFSVMSVSSKKSK